VLIQDKNGIFLYANYAVEKIYGYKKESFIGKDHFFITAAGDYLSTLITGIIANFPNSNSIKVEKNIEDFVLYQFLELKSF